MYSVYTFPSILSIPAGLKSVPCGLHEGVRAVVAALEREYMTALQPIPAAIRTQLSPSEHWCDDGGAGLVCAP
jgi:hypothetical protein